MSYKGSFVAIITPFTKQLNIDIQALRNIVAWQIENNTDGIVCCGTTGEGINLSFEERLKVIEICVQEAKGKVPVIAGTTTASTKESVFLTQKAKDLGLDATLAIVPYYNRPTDKGCVAHFEKIAEVGLDMIVYENPIRTAKSLDLSTYKLLEDIPQIKAIKASCGTVENFKKIRSATKIPLFAGDDSIILEALNQGACGAISVIGNLMPKELSQITVDFSQNMIGKALIAFQKIQTLIQTLGLETNPQMVKYGMHLLNQCELYYRLPLLEPTFEHKQALKKQMELLHLIKPLNV